jgi:type I restriction enzyme S subunit
LLSVYRDLGVVPREGRDDNYNKPGEDLDTYKAVEPGDLVLNKMKTWQGSLGVSEHEGIVSPAYFVCQQISIADSRFLHHLLRSQPLIDEYARRSKGIRPAQWDLPWEEFRVIRVFLPPLSSQRAIADFLDAETARIDALIAKKQQTVELLQSSFRALRWTEISNGVVDLPRSLVSLPLSVKRWQRTRLKYLVSQPTGGTWGSEPDEDEVNVVCYRVADFDRWLGTASSDEPTIRSVPSSLLHRLALSAGDLLLEKSGGGEKQPVGFAARYTGSNTPAVWSNFIARLRPVPAVDAQFVAHVFAAVYEQSMTVPFIKQTTGIQNLDIDAFLAQPWAIPPLDEQTEIRRRIDLVHQRASVLMAKILFQVHLLAEHRRALITAAVTGELDMPGVAA